jgi:predicted metal-dependent peptidase
VYVEHLEFLVKEVLLPLRNVVGTSNQILTETEIRAIFSETESILNYNRLLLVQLEERVPKWSVSQKLGMERKKERRGVVGKR